MSGKKITYLSADFFFDVDLPALQGLRSQFEVTWIAIFPIQKSRYTSQFLEEFCDYNGIDLIILRREYRKKDLRTLHLITKVFLKIARSRPDLIYVEDLGDLYFSLISIFLLNKEKTIVAFHDIVQHKKSKSSTFNSISQKLLLYFYKHIHVFSLTQKNFLRPVRNKNILVAPLYLKDFGRSKVLEKKREHIQFLFFGRIEHYKGLDILIKAVTLLEKQKLPKFTVTIAGNSDNWRLYEKLITNKEYFKLQIRFVDNQEIPDLFNNHDFLILPYRDVTQSGPLYIAYNYNLPIIASDHDEFKSLIHHEKTGYLFENENAYSLANILEQVVVERNQHIIKASLKKFINDFFSASKITKKYVDYFNAIINENERSI